MAKDKKEEAKKAEQAFTKSLKAKLGKVGLTLKKAMVSCLSQNVETMQVDLAHAKYRVETLKGFESIAQSKEYQEAKNDKQYGGGKGLSLWRAATMLTGIDKQVTINETPINVSRGAFSSLLTVAEAIARPNIPAKVKSVVYELTASVGRSALSQAIRDYQNTEDQNTASLVRTLLPKVDKSKASKEKELASRSPLEYLTDAQSSLETLLTHVDLLAKQTPEILQTLTVLSKELVSKADKVADTIRELSANKGNGAHIATLEHSTVSKKTTRIPSSIQPTAESKVVAAAIQSAADARARQREKDAQSAARRKSENGGKPSIAQA